MPKLLCIEGLTSKFDIGLVGRYTCTNGSKVYIYTQTGRETVVTPENPSIKSLVPFEDYKDEVSKNGFDSYHHDGYQGVIIHHDVWNVIFQNREDVEDIETIAYDENKGFHYENLNKESQKFSYQSLSPEQIERFKQLEADLGKKKVAEVFEEKNMDTATPDTTGKEKNTLDSLKSTATMLGRALAESAGEQTINKVNDQVVYAFQEGLRKLGVSEEMVEHEALIMGVKMVGPAGMYMLADIFENQINSRFGKEATGYVKYACFKATKMAIDKEIMDPLFELATPVVASLFQAGKEMHEADLSKKALDAPEETNMVEETIKQAQTQKDPVPA